MRAGTDQQWAEQLAGKIPASWRGFVLDRWADTRGTFDPSSSTAEGDARRAANVELRETIEQLTRHALPLKATDETVCAVAAKYADKCARFRVLFPTFAEQRRAMSTVCAVVGVEPAWGRAMDDAGAVARMCSPAFWRARLRRLHAQRVEGEAIKLGRVRRGLDCYVSDESLARRRQQNARNRAMLQQTTATNEAGQTYTLAQLAEKSVSNPALRRAELMTRIRGYEQLAVMAGHVGDFLTITCPSRMHKFREKDGRPVPNRKYDGTLPNQAQAYLSGVFARIRAELARQGLQWYGMRVTEPHHDGCPHWHVLVFLPADHVERVRAIVRHYALADSGTEPGAAERRVTCKAMNPAQGTAAGYIAKYIAKNIDGEGLPDDRNGNDGKAGAARVQAWAATWRIRQFQAVGGAPVTVWRELRRVETLPADAPAYLRDAHEAVNKRDCGDGAEPRVSWAGYVQAQGGVFCGRGYRVRLLKEPVEGLGRYGEARPDAPAGVECVDVLADGNTLRTVARSNRCVWTVKQVSMRHQWEILRNTSAGFVSVLAAADTAFTGAASATQPVDLKGDFDFSAGLYAPWTRVNNCTAGWLTRTANEQRRWVATRQVAAENAARWPIHEWTEDETGNTTALE